MPAARFRLVALLLAAAPSFAQAQTASEAALASKAHVFAMRLSDGNAGRVAVRPKKTDEKLNSLDGGAYWVDPHPVVSGAQVTDARVEKHDDGDGYSSPVVRVTLNAAGKAALAAYSAGHVGQSMVYVLDGSVIGTPVEITSKVEDGTLLVSQLGDARASQYFADQIRSAKAP